MLLHNWKLKRILRNRETKDKRLLLFKAKDYYALISGVWFSARLGGLIKLFRFIKIFKDLNSLFQNQNIEIAFHSIKPSVLQCYVNDLWFCIKTDLLMHKWQRKWERQLNIKICMPKSDLILDKRCGDNFTESYFPLTCHTRCPPTMIWKKLFLCPAFLNNAQSKFSMPNFC